jgi:hypothetical protein
MADGLGLAGGFGAGAAANALQDVLREARIKQLQQQEARNRVQLFQRQLEQDAESTRRFNLTHQRAIDNDKSLALGREAEAARDRAAAEKEANRLKGLQALIDDPTTPAPLRNLLRLNALGVGNVGIHDVEGTDAHSAHVRAENALKSENAFDDWRRRADYTEQQRRNRPVLIARGARLAPGQDDPSLPHGAQRYLVEIARKHAGDYNAAVSELNSYLQHPQTRADHPGLSPTKALNALRLSFSGAGRPSSGDDDETDIVDETIREVKAARSGGTEPVYRHPDGTTRAYPAGPDAQPRPPRPPYASQRPQPQADVQLRARAREALRQRLGRDVTDEEVTKILESPKNRQLLGGQ